MKSSRSLRLTLPLFFAISGCAANRPDLTCPKLGGPAWTQVDSPHFMVQTDLSEQKGREMAAELELSRAALISVLKAPADEAAAPVEVIVLERARDFMAATQKDTAGLYFPRLQGDLETQRVVAAQGGLDEPTRFILQHEMVHEIVRRRTGRLPWWLDEGLAKTFETVHVDGDTVVVGEPPAGGDFWENLYEAGSYAPRLWKYWYPVVEAPKLDFLLHTNGSFVWSAGRERLYYAAAWKLVHVLRGDVESTFRPRFSAMLSALMSGTPGEEAYTQAYRGAPIGSVAAAYDKYLLDHHEYMETLPFTPPPPASVKARPLPDAEVHAIWARLERQIGEGVAEDELARGLSHNPDAPALLYVKASIRLAASKVSTVEADIAALRRVDPYNPRYLLLHIMSFLGRRDNSKLASFTPDEASELSALTTLLTRIATSPFQRAISMVFFAYAGQIEAALARGEALVKANPSCEVCLSAYAETLLVAGAPGKARDAAERALALLEDGQSDPDLKKLIQRAKAAENKTAPPRPSPAPGGGPNL